MITFGSVCSGIEAASVAWLPLGARCAFMSEIDAFPRAVLQHHYPETPLHGDFTTIKAGEYAAIDVLVGGTPCQSFSVAGLRGGLADERGNLALEYLRLAKRLRPRWLVWENVPGVLSSGEGRDFGAFVGGLAELGYGWSYRVLDAQYFGLAQRRKRVFVVGHLGDWRRAAAVLFEPQGLRWHPAPSRATREGIAAPLTRGADSSGKGGYSGRRQEDDVNLVAGTLGSRRTAGGGLGTDFDLDGGLIAKSVPARAWASHREDSDTLVAMSLNAHAGRMDGESETFVVPLLEIGKGSSSRGQGPNGAGFGGTDDPMFTLQAGAQHGVAFQTSQSGVRDHETHATLDANNGSRRHNGAIVGSAVRRLTPRECERLQGFPDDYTLISYRGKPAADGPRYRALGNSMAVPVMTWIGRRIVKQNRRSLFR